MGRGRTHDSLNEILTGITAMMTQKITGGHRPLGYGLAFRRAVFSLVTKQKQPKWEKTFTTMHPKDVAKWEADIAAAEAEVSAAQWDMDVAAAGNEAAQDAAMVRLGQAMEREAAARAPRNFVCNYAFTKRG